jgi:hypothetical protein
VSTVLPIVLLLLVIGSAAVVGWLNLPCMREVGLGFLILGWVLVILSAWRLSLFEVFPISPMIWPGAGVLLILVGGALILAGRRGGTKG